MGKKHVKICAISTISKTMDWFMIESMRNLAKNGYDVTLVCDMDEEFIARNKDFATCYPLKMKRGISIGDIFRCTSELRRLFRKEKFDVIYYMSPNASFYASLAGKQAHVKYRVYSQCGLRYVSLTGIKRKIFKFVEKLTCSFSTHIRAQSALNRQFVIDEKVCSANKVDVIGIGGTIGVDLSFCDSINKEQINLALRKRYNIKQDDFVYGFVGRINADKGCEELIKAFNIVKNKNKNVKLMLVGMIDEVNGISCELLESAEKDENIILTGIVPPDKVYEYMTVFNVLVHPTYREGFGKVLQEAMGMSLPIITTDVPGPKEVVEDGISGVLVPAKNVDVLAEKMIELYDDERLRNDLATAGRLRAEKYFDRPIMLKNILDDMNKIVGRDND